MKSDLDLNLLNVLVLLYKHRQIGPVAKSLGKTESAISKYLAKLRTQLNDPLFIRKPYKLEPTEYTTRIVPMLSDGLNKVYAAGQREVFDPEDYESDITVALPDIAQFWFGHKLMFDLIELFPKANIELVTWDERSMYDILEGTLDLGVSYFNSGLNKSVYQHNIGEVKPMIVSPVGIDTADIHDLLKLPFILPEAKATDRREYASKLLLESLDVKLDHRAILDSVPSLLEAIKENNCAAIMHNFGHSIDGYHLTDLPTDKRFGDFPSVVANYKLSNRGHPLQTLIIDRIKQYVLN